ncbi:glycosyltransferase [Alloalcanivorax marinus]|uniref:glycosyltransferase n=1 Tax=Alloalcanivorax marinus TaxID=1177169 RepID=UPI00195B927E|nr:glycosyltransferase [Alloalcanivorax marinus]MBM7333638.1 glycosyltransferase [Alloalcanivorax marinus]
MKKKRVAVVCYDMQWRGVQQTQKRLAASLVDLGYQVDLVLVNAVGPLMEDLPQSVDVFDLEASSAKKALPGLVKYFKKRRPLGVLASEDHVNCMVIIATRLVSPNTKVSISCHVSPSTWLSDATSPFKKEWWVKLAIKALYPMANQCVLLSQKMAFEYRSEVGLKGLNFKVIPNPVAPRDNEVALPPHRWLSEDKSVRIEPVIIAVGALSRLKNFSLLVSAFSLLNKQKKSKLIIIGEGPKRKELENQIKLEGLVSSVELVGFQSKPMSFMAHADMLVMSSLSEGFGNVLIEAMAAACPIVSTRCGGGVEEILADGKYGELVEINNPEALAAAMARTLDQPIQPNVLIKASRRYDPLEITSRYMQGLGI